MGKTGFRCEIPDWYGIHSGFNLLLCPGYTALVGPNGAGKTTLLLQLEEIAKERGYEVFYYANAKDGGDRARQQYLDTGDQSSHMVAKAIKGKTSRILRDEFPPLSRMPSLWTRSYFASTAGNVSSETIKRYIDTQPRTNAAAQL